jgi:hypothetical protein
MGSFDAHAADEAEAFSALAGNRHRLGSAVVVANDRV